jgi:hypothetical protein
LSFLFAGCSDRHKNEVFGTVKVDGKLVEKGSITFISADGSGGTSGGDIKGGKYRVADVPAGSMKVQIRVPEVVGQKKLYDTDESKVRNVYRETLPKKFNDQTELVLEVRSGKNPKDWELSTEESP